MIETWDIQHFAKCKPDDDFNFVSGSFDPPHLGHIELFKQVLKKILIAGWQFPHIIYPKQKISRLFH